MRKNRNAEMLATVHTHTHTHTSRFRQLIAVGLLAVVVTTSVCIFALKNKENVVYGAEETGERFNPENLQDNEHMHVEIDESGDKVPVPNGYVGSKATGENKIDTGYVIYEGTEKVNNSNVEEAQKTRNQYVWIPVPDASTMYGTDENGKKWGKLYNFSTSSNNTNYDEVTGTYPLNWSEIDEVMRITSKASNKEPYVIIDSGDSSYDLSSKVKYLDNNINGAYDFLIQLEQEFNSMIESTEKYGGFYIGRYETGNLSNKAVIRKNNSVLGGQNWHAMYSKCKKLKNKNENVEAGMIFGSQYDRTLMWLIESKCKTKEEIIEDSTNWGNYLNSTFEFMNIDGSIVTKREGKYAIIPTGSSEYTKANNIYDLAGNIREYSIECCYGGRVGRGGCQAYYGNKYPSSNRNTEPMFRYNDLGCRAMLYIK